jgi:hypothetical protein
MLIFIYIPRIIITQMNHVHAQHEALPAINDFSPLEIIPSSLRSPYLNDLAESEQTTPCQDCPPDFLFIRYKLLAPMKSLPNQPRIEYSY